MLTKRLPARPSSSASHPPFFACPSNKSAPQWVPAEQLPVQYGGQCATPLGESELELQMAAYVRKLNQQAGAAAEGAAAAGNGGTGAGAEDAEAADAWADAEDEQVAAAAGSAASGNIG